MQACLLQNKQLWCFRPPKRKALCLEVKSSLSTARLNCTTGTEKLVRKIYCKEFLKNKSFKKRLFSSASGCMLTNRIACLSVPDAQTDLMFPSTPSISHFFMKARCFCRNKFNNSLRRHRQNDNSKKVIAFNSNRIHLILTSHSISSWERVFSFSSARFSLLWQLATFSFNNILLLFVALQKKSFNN